VSAGLRQWPRRRWLLAAAVFPGLVILFAAAGTGSLAASPASWWTWPWLVVNSALASVTVASYLALPGARKVIDVGCSPCAAVAGLALVAALMAHSSAPASPDMAVAASALTAFALRQRLTDANSCAAPASPRAESAAPSSAAGDQSPAVPAPAAALPEPRDRRDAGGAGGDAAARSMLRQ
jgi:hypothetical protein